MPSVYPKTMKILCFHGSIAFSNILSQAQTGHHYFTRTCKLYRFIVQLLHKKWLTYELKIDGCKTLMPSIRYY
uniref:Uncharacterized protein n=1 Tax=Oryza brachyantha TaxID=4533 RepID=J3MI68_ORYBR